MRANNRLWFWTCYKKREIGGRKIDYKNERRRKMGRRPKKSQLNMLSSGILS